MTEDVTTIFTCASISGLFDRANTFDILNMAVTCVSAFAIVMAELIGDGAKPY